MQWRAVYAPGVARVLVTRPLPDGWLDPLAAAGHEAVVLGDGPLTHGELVGAIDGYDALVCTITDRVDRDVFAAAAARLRVVGTIGVGYDNVDVAAASEHGVAVCNTPGVLDETTADLAFLLLLAAARRCPTPRPRCAAAGGTGSASTHSSASICTAPPLASWGSAASARPSHDGPRGSA